jgi:nucleotide-binding universal stress UspA family protein
MKVLFATDGTKYSECALATIGKFNFTAGDELKIISVLDLALPSTVDIYAGYLPSTVEIEQSFKENAERIVTETKEKIKSFFPGSDFILETEILIGSPENKIVEAANQMKADLVIVGSHGYNRLERILLGSVSDSVVHHAPCSVMVIRSVKDQ